MANLPNTDDWATLCLYGVSAARFARRHATDVLAGHKAATNTNSTRESVNGLRLLRSRGGVRAGLSRVKATSTARRQVIEVSLLGTTQALRYVLVVSSPGAWRIEQMELVVS